MTPCPNDCHPRVRGDPELFGWEDVCNGDNLNIFLSSNSFPFSMLLDPRVREDDNGVGYRAISRAFPLKDLDSSVRWNDASVGFWDHHAAYANRG